MSEKPGWLSRLRAGLQKSSDKLATGIGDIFTKQALDEAALEKLEEVLIEADLGPATAARIAEEFSEHRFGKDATAGEIRHALAGHIAAALAPVAKPLAVDAAKKPFVVVVAGVNGSGKTTTIGKLAHNYKEQGLRVVLAAGDTFRAAAISQLKIWGGRTGAVVVAGEPRRRFRRAGLSGLRKSAQG